MPGDETTKEDLAARWFRERAERFLRSVGVHECQQVADVGCHDGHFTLPAARIVASCGKVYAVDKDPVHDGRLVRGRVFLFSRPPH